MSFARDNLYNEYVRPNMSTIIKSIKVMEIMVHLPCLTNHDRETIEARFNTNGNHSAAMHLLDCLKRRENWEEQFITALEECEQTQLAAEMRENYEALRVTRNSRSALSPSRFPNTRAHRAPAASFSAEPESPAVNNPPAVDLPPEAPADLTRQTPPSPERPLRSAGPVPQAVSPPELFLDSPQSARTELPPLPSSPHPENSGAHQIDVLQTGMDAPDFSSDAALTPDESNLRDNEAVMFQLHPVTPTPAVLLQPTGGDDAQSPTLINSEAADGILFSPETPEKVPVQDTTPPTITNTVLQPEETSEPPAGEVSESVPVVEAAPPIAPEPPADHISSFLDDVCLSKPGQLVSVPLQSPGGPAAPSSSETLEPYSGNSDRLEMSKADNSPIHQENGITPNHNEPEENHYESPNESMVQIVGHISEHPSILNEDGVTPAPNIQVLNGEEGSAIHPDGSLLDLNPPEPASVQVSPVRSSDGKMCPESRSFTSSNTMYVLIAVAVGAGALLLAWRFRK